MKIRLIGIACFATAVLLLGTNINCVPKKDTDNTNYVNTFIGTGGHGHTFPGATLPHAMVQLSPDTRTMGWDACGGYHYSDSSIIGFSHTHLSGTGISDLGDFLFMPYAGEVKTDAGTPEQIDDGYRSRFSHTDEVARPGYYSVHLKDYAIDAELTVSKRAGFHRYTFKGTDTARLIIDLSHNIYPDNQPEHSLKVLDKQNLQGMKKSGGWAQEQHAFFSATFNKPFMCQLFNGDSLLANNQHAEGDKLKAVLTFAMEAGDELLVKVGISHLDAEGASKNQAVELPDWDFDRVVEDAHDIWANKLSAINVEGGNAEQRTIFYTSLYHTSISPYLFSDADGRYRGMDQKLYHTDSEMHTVFSLWDTFRAFHPLQTIVNNQQNNQFIRSLLKKYDEGGVLPMWELVGNYTGCMIGYHAVPVIVDAYMKGQRDFDVEKAYKAIKESAFYQTEGILFPNRDVQNKLMPLAKRFNEELGYIPCDLEPESVGKALEYAYNDWCIAQMAKELGKVDDFTFFMERSKRYAKYFDVQTGFMRGKDKDGNWREPFNPRHSNHRADDYVEGNAYQWSWFVPHDVEGLMTLYGGAEQMAIKLDTLFSTSSDLVGDHVSNDISGLIGQYAHGNEPSHHVAHLYNYIGQGWKSQALLDQIMNELYFNDSNGLSGNEDCGQMSAWYVLNAMGFYSVCPGNPVYSIGRPLFDKVEIKLENGNVVHINAKNNSETNCYVKSVSLNGKPLGAPFFDHRELMAGATIELVMSDQPNKNLFK